MNPRKAEIKTKFQSVTLPVLSDQDNADDFYNPILDTLSIRTKFELKMLRDVVTEELMRTQERILAKAFQDVLDGKLEGPEWDYFDNLWESEDECCEETEK